MREDKNTKSRVAITIDAEFIQWIDHKIDEKIFASRSHAIEFAIKRLIEEEKAKKM